MKNYLNLFNTFLGNTCFILKGEEIIFESKERGVKPILDYYHMFGKSEDTLIIVDKIMGRGAIILAKLINANTIQTPIISKDALLLANYYNMNCTYDTVVDYIVNREKNGRCPIESSVLNETDEIQGYKKIINALRELEK